MKGEESAYDVPNRNIDKYSTCIILYSQDPNKSTPQIRAPVRKKSIALIKAPPQIRAPPGKSQVYRYEFLLRKLG